MLFEQEVNRVGYLSRSVPDREHLVEAILALKKEKNAIILAHYYVSEDIQKLPIILVIVMPLLKFQKSWIPK
jgi:quinolinate synthase